MITVLPGLDSTISNGSVACHTTTAPDGHAQVMHDIRILPRKLYDYSTKSMMRRHDGHDRASQSSFDILSIHSLEPPESYAEPGAKQYDKTHHVYLMSICFRIKPPYVDGVMIVLCHFPMSHLDLIVDHD